MKKKISTLVPDIEQLFWDVIDGGAPYVDDVDVVGLGCKIAAKVKGALSGKERTRPAKTLYMSEVGKPCHRQIWYDHHLPLLREKLMPQTLVKFLYGDIVEELVLFLAKAAGHEVTDEQKPVELKLRNGWVARGRMDARIDGTLVDVKSASGYSTKKFQEGLDDTNDAFGYREQLNGYVVADGIGPHSGNDDAGFVVMNKENGKLVYAEHTAPLGYALVDRLNVLVEELEDVSPPLRKFPLKPEGASGNLKLGVECSYCPYKYECWKDANDGDGLRTFIYSTGPVFLGTVNTTPRVTEITDKIKALHIERINAQEKAAA